MKRTTLKELLTPRQSVMLEHKLNELKTKGVKPEDTQFVAELKVFFRRWEKELLEKGVLPDYLAYAVMHITMKGARQ